MSQTLAEAPEPATSTRRPRIDESFNTRLRDREPEALAAFYEQHFERVYQYVRRHVRDEHSTEDLTQEIFVRVYVALPRYDPCKDVRPWLFTIAANKIRDYWRSRPRVEAHREASLDDGVASVLPAEDDSPGSELERREVCRAVRDAIADLPETLRTTLLLRLYEELSFEAIGERLDRRVLAVRKRYSRALQALRGTLVTPYLAHVSEN